MEPAQFLGDELGSGARVGHAPMDVSPGEKLGEFDGNAAGL